MLVDSLQVGRCHAVAEPAQTDGVASNRVTCARRCCIFRKNHVFTLSYTRFLQNYTRISMTCHGNIPCCSQHIMLSDAATGASFGLDYTKTYVYGYQASHTIYTATPCKLRYPSPVKSREDCLLCHQTKYNHRGARSAGRHCTAEASFPDGQVKISQRFICTV